VEAAQVDNAILLDYLPSEAALEDAVIGTTDPNIPIHNSCMDDELHFGMPRCSRDYEDERDEGDMRDAIPAASQRQRPTTQLNRFDLATSHVDGYKGEEGDDVDADDVE
jgi:hypothetical protein